MIVKVWSLWQRDVMLSRETRKARRRVEKLLRQAERKSKRQQQRHAVDRPQAGQKADDGADKSANQRNQHLARRRLLREQQAIETQVSPLDPGRVDEFDQIAK